MRRMFRSRLLLQLGESFLQIQPLHEILSAPFWKWLGHCAVPKRVPNSRTNSQSENWQASGVPDMTRHGADRAEPPSLFQQLLQIRPGSPQQHVITAVTRQRHARAPSRCATMLDVQHLKWLLHWLGHWKSRRIPAGKRFAFTAMQKFKRYLQIVRDAPCFFALLIFEQRPVIDRLRYYAVR